MYYHRKLIISGKYFELYEYKKSLKREFKRTRKKPSEKLQLDLLKGIEKNKESRQMLKRLDSIRLTRSKIRRIINSNPDFSKFTTLTFRENITDVSIANKHFNKFIMRLNYKYPDLKYIAIIEFQKRGAVHYHFLSNLCYIPNHELGKIWGLGFIKINKIKTVDNLGAYVCKYLQKDMTEKRLFNRKKFFCSKNIEKPTTIYDDKIIEELILQYGFNSVKPAYESTFSNKYIGDVIYKQFKLKNFIA